MASAACMEKFTTGLSGSHVPELSHDLLVMVVSFVKEPQCHWPFLSLVCHSIRNAVQDAIKIYNETYWKKHGLPAPILSMYPHSKPRQVPASIDGIFMSCSRLLYTIKCLVPYSPWLAAALTKTTLDPIVRIGVLNYRRAMIETLKVRAEYVNDSICAARFNDVAICAMTRRGSLTLIRKSFFELMNGLVESPVSLAMNHYMALVRGLASEGRCDVLEWLVKQNPSYPTSHLTGHGINMLLHGMVCKTTRTQTLWEQLIASLIIPAVKNDCVKVLKWLQDTTREISNSYNNVRARGFLMHRRPGKAADTIVEWGDIFRYCASEAARNNSICCLEFLYQSGCNIRDDDVCILNIDLRFLILACALGSAKRHGAVSEWAKNKIRKDGYVRLSMNTPVAHDPYVQPDFENFVEHVEKFCMHNWPRILEKTPTYTNYVMRVSDMKRTIFQSSDPDHMQWVLEHCVPGGWIWRTWLSAYGLGNHTAWDAGPEENHRREVTTTICRLAARTARQSMVIQGDTQLHEAEPTRQRLVWVQTPKIEGPSSVERTFGCAVERWIEVTLDQCVNEPTEEACERLKTSYADVEWVLLFRDLPLVAYPIFEKLCNRYLFDMEQPSTGQKHLIEQRTRILRALITRAVIPSIGENLTRVLQTLPAYAAMLGIANRFGMIRQSEKLSVLLTSSSNYDAYKAIANSFCVEVEGFDEWKTRAAFSQEDTFARQSP